MDYYLHLIILTIFYTLLAQSLNLSAGLTGLISLSHAAFYAIGAYTTAILSQQLDLPFWINLPIAMIICSIASACISLISLRVIDDYFIICTLGIQIIIFSLINNWTSLTNGSAGISNISQITFFSIKLESEITFLVMSTIFLVIIWWLLSNLFNSAFGRTLQAISEDEIYTQSIGKNVYAFKVTSYVLSAAIAAIPGVLYAHYTTRLDPKNFTVSESIFILSIVIVGGMGNLFGSFIASAFMIFMPEVLRLIGISNTIAANLRQIVFGAALVLVIMSGKNGIGGFFKKQTDPN